MTSLIMEPLQDSKISSINAGESMEIDEYARLSESSVEDGEISESDVVASDKIYQNRDGDFTTGVDIFSTETKGKLTERAKRFGIDPKILVGVTDEELQELRSSLGITEPEERNIRFDTIHVRGTENMSTEDVFEYFKVYEPAKIEWINDYSCNVVWNEYSSTARALKGLSKAIKGLKKNKNDEAIEDVPGDSADVERTVIVSKLQDDDGDVVMVAEEFIHALNNDTEGDSVHASTIKIPIPPGYWRFGQPYLKAKCILLRFATKSDRKPIHAEKRSTYYKKYGNPNFGGLKGLISDSKRKSKHFHPADVLVNDDVKKNPWGRLSQNWNDEPQELSLQKKPTVGTNKSVLDRIGLKRSSQAKVASVKGSSDCDSDSSEEWRKKIKIPRMKMYADEEQKRIDKTRQQKVTQKDARLRLKPQEYSEDEEISQIIIQKPIIVKSNVKSRLGKIVSRESYVADPQRRDIKQRLSQRMYSDDSDNSDITTFPQAYPSVVTKIKRPSPIRPTMASTISRQDIDRRRNNTSESSYVSSDNEVVEKDLRQSIRTKSVVHRPGFDKADLRSRLSHKSMAQGSKALKIEIDNDYYSDS